MSIAEAEPILVGKNGRRKDAEIRITEAAGRVEASYIAFRVQRGKLPGQRTFSNGQIDRAVQPLNAKRKRVSMAKKLFPADHPAVKALNEVNAKVDRLVMNKEYTLPCPEEPGCRLVKRGSIDLLNDRMNQLKDELDAAARRVKNAMNEIVDRSRNELGDLFDPSDYSLDPEETCYVKWDFPPLHKVDEDLADISPEVYQAELQRVRNLYESSCRAKAEEMAMDMYTMLDRLIAALEGTGEDGKRKIFRDATVNNIFAALDHAESQLDENGIGSGPLKDAFDSLRRVVDGRRAGMPQQLREGNDEFRQGIRQRLVDVASTLENLGEVKPRRALLRQRAVSMALKVEEAPTAEATTTEES